MNRSYKKGTKLSKNMFNIVNHNNKQQECAGTVDVACGGVFTL